MKDFKVGLSGEGCERDSMVKPGDSELSSKSGFWKFSRAIWYSIDECLTRWNKFASAGVRYRKMEVTMTKSFVKTELKWISDKKFQLTVTLC